MFTGHDPNGDNLNQFVNFGIAAAAAAGSIGPIDWATLAQQWIQMRDHSANNEINYNQTNMPEAPPPPHISGGTTQVAQEHGKLLKNISTFEEQGEADMDMDDDVEQNKSVLHPPKVDNWLSEPIPPAPQWNAWAGSVSAPMYQNPQGTGLPLIRPPPTGATHAQIPSLLKMPVHHAPHGHIIKQMPPTHTFPTAPPSNVDPNQSMPIIDAAKRKVLPAWIREGLEKMERDKLKQLEKEQQNQNNSETEDNDIENGEELAREIIKTDKEIISSNMVKSKYTHTLTSDDEQENSGNELEPAIHNNIEDENDDDEVEGDGDGVNDEYSSGAKDQQLNVVKSYEDKFTEMMMVVRRTLTELLLDVTNTEILNIAQETLKSQQLKASSAQVISKSALSSITGKLGLAVYGDSSSGESSEDEEETAINRQSSNSDIDSEEELRRTIRLKKREFERTADEIEDEIATAAELEEKRFKMHAQKEAHEERRHKLKNSEDGSTNLARNMGKGFDQEFGETTSDSKLPYLNGKEKQQRDRLIRKERTTRFSDSREPKTVSLAAAAKYFSQLQQQQHQQQQQTQSYQNLNNTSEYDAGTSSSTGLHNMLNAAEAALKKASKAAENYKLQPEERHQQRDYKRHSKRSRSRTRSTNSSTSSSKTNSYTSSMSSKRHNKKHRSKDKRKEKHRRRHRRSRSSSSSRSSDDHDRKRKYQSRDRDREYSHSRKRHSRSRSPSSSHRKRSSSRDYDRHNSNKHKERSTSRSYSRSTRSHSTHYSRHKH